MDATGIVDPPASAPRRQPVMAIIEFPDPRTATPEGMVAIGGDLHPESLCPPTGRGSFRGRWRGCRCSGSAPPSAGCSSSPPARAAQPGARAPAESRCVSRSTRSSARSFAPAPIRPARLSRGPGSRRRSSSPTCACTGWGWRTASRPGQAVGLPAASTGSTSTAPSPPRACSTSAPTRPSSPCFLLDHLRAPVSTGSTCRR